MEVHVILNQRPFDFRFTDPTMIGKKNLCRSSLSIVILINLGIFETAYFVTRIRVGGAPNHSGERFQKDAFLGEWLQWFRVDRRSICVKSMWFQKYPDSCGRIN